MKLVHGHGQKKAAPARRAMQMHIARAKNGFMVRTHHEPGSGGKRRGGMMPSLGYEPPEESVFPSHADLLRHVTDKFGPPGGQPSEVPAPGSPPVGQAVPAGGTPQRS